MPTIRIAPLLAMLAAVLPIPARAALECEDFGNLLARSCRTIADTWTHGGHELYLTGYAYHVPATWTPEKRAELNSNGWGGGYGRSVDDADGDNHAVFGIAFLDSHRHVQFQVGYAWHRFWGPRDGLQAGLGYTAMIAQRPDIWNGVPFPVVLPLAALRYRKATLEVTFIPTLSGNLNHGSTLFAFGRVALD